MFGAIQVALFLQEALAPDNTITILWGAGNSGQVAVNYKDGNNCSAAMETQKNITINALPTINAGPDQVAAVGATSVTMSGYSYTGASGADWSGGNGTWAMDVYTPTAAEIAAGSIILTYTTNSAAPCAEVSDNVTVDFMDYVVNNTVLSSTSGTIADLTATFPSSIPPVIVAEPYTINSRMTLSGDPIPAGSTVSILITVNGFGPLPYVTNAAIPASPFWVTDLAGGTAADFDAGYAGRIEVYSISINSAGGNPLALNAIVDIESVISKDNFTTEVVLDEITLNAPIAPDEAAALAWVQTNTILSSTSGTIADLTATFPSSIPPVIVAEPYKINSRMTLSGDPIPAGSTVSILITVNGFGPLPYVTNAAIPASPFWVTDLAGGTAADFDAGYAGRIEVYSISINSAGGNPLALNAIVDIESVISKDNFTTEVVLDEITLNAPIAPDEAAALAWVQTNTILSSTSGTIADLTATFPSSIPPVIVAEPYKINSRMTLSGDPIPAGSTVSILITVNGFGPLPYVTNAAIPASPFWVTDLAGGTAADFDAGYAGRIEVYSISINSAGGNMLEVNGVVKVESIISKDNFVTQVVLDDINLNFKILPDESVAIHNLNKNLFYTTIQGAINDADPNNVIQVGNGTFYENIAINKALLLKGANADVECENRVAAESIIAPTNGLPFSVTADGVTINGFEITAPSNTYAINGSNTSNLNVIFNNIHHVGSSLTSGYVHSVVYQVANATATSNVNISDNCFSYIGSSSLTGSSASAIGILQSTSTGVLTDLFIERNTIDYVEVNTGNWPTGKIAYGIQLNTGSANYTTTDGKILNAQIIDNTITNLKGFISTGIGLEGNTENAVVEGNTVANLTGYKLANRAGGGYDLNALKFETNRYVGTVMVQDNSFQSETFTFGSSATNNGYAVANYVPIADGGAAEISCNWLGTANYGEIVAEYTYFTGKVFNKEGAGTDFIEYLTTPTIGTGSSCNGVNATPANLNLSYTEAAENVVVTFDVAGNSSVIYPIPGLTDPAAIAAKYNALQTALTGGDPVAIKSAALEIGDDIITEYFYMEGGNKVYLQTAGGNPLVKNKYWDEYLNNTSTSLRYPSFANNRFIVPIGGYSTSTNPNTGGAVNNGWLAPVYGKTLYITVTFLHNGEVNFLTQGVSIPAAPVVNTITGLGYMQIQTAIDDPLTLDGHIITVEAGTYPEVLYIYKELDIQGPNYGIDPNTESRNPEATIQFPPSNTSWYLVYIDGDGGGGSTVTGVSINGFEFNGVDSYSGNSTELIFVAGAENVSINDNILKNFESIAIRYYYQYYDGTNWIPTWPIGADISDNYISNPDFYFDYSTYGAAPNTGIYLQGVYGSVSGNVVEHVLGGCQIQPYGHPNTTSVTGTVSGNKFKASRNGLWYNNSSSANADWLFSGNTLSGILFPSGYTPGADWYGEPTDIWYGFAINGNSYGELAFTGNTIEKGTTTLEAYGIRYVHGYAHAPKTAITNNFIDNLAYGVYLPVNLVNVGEILINNNSISGNSDYGVYNATTSTVDATCNWWGTTNPATVAASVLGDVQFLPFSTSASPMNCLGFGPVVNTTNDPDRSYMTIQEAIDASTTIAGDVIEVSAGTYAEDIVLNKPLDLRGPNFNISPNGGSRFTEAIVVPATSNPDYNTGGQILYMENTASGTLIRGFIFDGDNPLLTSGVIMNGADVDVVEALSAYGGLSNVTVTNNIFQNINYCAIDFYNYYNSGHLQQREILLNIINLII